MCDLGIVYAGGKLHSFISLDGVRHPNAVELIAKHVVKPFLATRLVTGGWVYDSVDSHPQSISHFLPISKFSKSVFAINKIVSAACLSTCLFIVSYIFYFNSIMFRVN